MMEADTSGWSIILVGQWNVAIFTPEWISGHLTESPEIGYEVAIGNPALPARVTFEDIYISFVQDRLILTPKIANQGLLVRMEEVGRKILDALPHTPVSGVGVNFQYGEKEPDREILDLFHLADSDKLSDDARLLIRATNLERKLERDGQVLNLKIGQNENGFVLFGLNFHRNVSNALEASSYLNDSVVRFWTEGKELLRNLYNLESDAD